MKKNINVTVKEIPSIRDIVPSNREISTNMNLLPDMLLSLYYKAQKHNRDFTVNVIIGKEVTYVHDGNVHYWTSRWWKEYHHGG